jgi:hypothetical protein
MEVAVSFRSVRDPSEIALTKACCSLRHVLQHPNQPMLGRYTDWTG